MGSRYRKQEEVRLELTGGDWLLVRKHLTAGEERDAHAKVIKAGTMRSGERPELDLEHLGIAQAVSYLIDWSITDADDKPIRIRDASYPFIVRGAQKPDAGVAARDPRRDPGARHGDDRGAGRGKKTPGWRERTVSDLYICRMMGWTYDDLLDLPVDVYTRPGRTAERGSGEVPKVTDGPLCNLHGELLLLLRRRG